MDTTGLFDLFATQGSVQNMELFESLQRADRL